MIKILWLKKKNIYIYMICFFFVFKHLIMEDLEQSKIQSSEKTDAVLEQKEDYLDFISFSTEIESNL